MRDLRILFLPYVGLALFSGIAIGGHEKLGLKGSMILAAIHVVLIAFAIYAGHKSKVQNAKPVWFKMDWRLPLSPVGWYISLVLVYTTFFVLGFRYAP